MAQNSWPFVGGGGTAVNEDQWSIMARSWVQSGVGDYANKLEVYGDSTGRQVKIKTGRATVRGHWYENTAEITQAIAANSSGNPRIDRVVLRLDPAANSIVVAVVQGTPAGSPSPPALTQTDVGVYEISLAKVAVANGASTINAGDVTDERTYAGDLAMGGHRITGLPAAAAAGEPVRFEQMREVYALGVRSTPQTVSAATSATLTFESETDPTGMLTPASGVVTIASGGVYIVTATVSANPPDINSVCILDLADSGGTSLVTAAESLDAQGRSLSGVWACAPGYTVRLRVVNNSAGSIGVAGSLSLSRIPGI